MMTATDAKNHADLTARIAVLEAQLDKMSREVTRLRSRYSDDIGTPDELVEFVTELTKRGDRLCITMPKLSPGAYYSSITVDGRTFNLGDDNAAITMKLAAVGATFKHT